MTTEKQIVANQANAEKSTGPRTPEGKAIVSRNATKHGLLSRHVLLRCEDEQELVELGKRLRAQLAPVGELENLLVERIIAAAWRLRRVVAVETGVFEKKRFDWQGKDLGLGVAFMEACTSSDAFAKLCRYEGHIERGMYRALHELQRLQAARSGQAVPPPAVLDVDVTSNSDTLRNGG